MNAPAPDLDTRPAADAVGWCHSCETWQRGRDARWLAMRWAPGLWQWACIRCDDEPWGLGVWTCQCGGCESVEPQAMGCWKVDHGRCADALCVAYGGCQDHGPT